MGCKIRNLIRLRKQSDTMKIICMLAFAGICFLVSAIHHLAGIYLYVNSPEEYVLSGDRTVSTEHVNQLLQLESGMAVSRQKSIPVTVVYKGLTTTFDSLVISKEYAKAVFGIHAIEGTKRFYMNDGAFLEWKRGLEESGEAGEGINIENSMQNDAGMEVDIKYMLDGDDADTPQDGRCVLSPNDSSTTEDVSPNYKKGKISVMKEGKMKEKIIFMIGEVNDLQKDAYGLRVRFQKHDLDGMHVEKIEKLGYSFENKDMIIKDEYSLKLKLIHIKYKLLCLALCILSVCVMAHHLPNDESRQYH